jgi:CHASE3 domain sensor protein
MFDILAKYVDEILHSMVDQTASQIRKEVEYAALTIKGGIEDGIKEGLDAARKTFFYLAIGTASTVVALVFMTWGLAQMFEAMFSQKPGVGFVVFGLVLLLLGMVSFAMSKPK